MMSIRIHIYRLVIQNFSKSHTRLSNAWIQFVHATYAFFPMRHLFITRVSLSSLTFVNLRTFKDQGFLCCWIQFQEVYVLQILLSCQFRSVFILSLICSSKFLQSSHYNACWFYSNNYIPVLIHWIKTLAHAVQILWRDVIFFLFFSKIVIYVSLFVKIDWLFKLAWSKISVCAINVHCVFVRLYFWFFSLISLVKIIS